LGPHEQPGALADALPEVAKQVGAGWNDMLDQLADVLQA